MLGPRSLHARVVAPLLAALLAVAAPTSANAGETLHTVAKGHTLGKIAKRYHTTVASIREVNDLKPGQPIRPGLVLVIPEKGKEAEAAKKAAAMRQGSQGKGSDASKKGGKDAKDEKGSSKGKGKDADRSKGKARDDGRAKEQETVGKGEKFAKKPKRLGFVKIVRGSDRFETQLLTRHGRLVPSALPGISRMLSFGPTGAKIPIDPRLATLLGMVSDHFGGRPMHIVSGYRPFSPRQYTRHSKHNVGHAVDFSIEGVPNTVLRDFCRTFRNAGVGYYPNSTFVHLDVRTTKVYWVDYSRPGEPPRYDRSTNHVAADESASEVVPNEGEGEGGSKDTHEAPSEPTDTTGGNQDAAGSGSGKSGTEGQARPTPGSAPSGVEKAPAPVPPSP
jgi:uncharacterized protein YcbK (DUF882 family)/LysM repeat protein